MLEFLRMLDEFSLALLESSHPPTENVLFKFQDDVYELPSYLVETLRSKIDPIKSDLFALMSSASDPWVSSSCTPMTGELKTLV